MAVSFKKKSLANYLNELGSSSVSPGGGSAAALTAALGAALIEMVAGINEKRFKKKSGGKADPKSRQRIAALKQIRAKLTDLVTQDTEVFLKLAKFTKEERASKKYLKALKEAAGVPFQICRLAAEAMEMGLFEKDRTSRWLISDLMESEILLEASFKAAWLNVGINLRMMSDKKFVEKTKSDLTILEKKIAFCKKKLHALEYSS